MYYLRQVSWKEEMCFGSCSKGCFYLLWRTHSGWYSETVQRQYLRTDFYALSLAPAILSSFLGNGKISAEVMEIIPTKNSSQQHAYGMCLGSGRCSWRFIWSREKCIPSAPYSSFVQAEKSSTPSAGNISKWKCDLSFLLVISIYLQQRIPGSEY